MSKKLDAQIVVVDEGSAQAKATYFCRNTRTIVSKITPAMIGRDIDTDPVGNPLDNSYMADGEEYCVSPDLQTPINTKRETYQTSTENRVLVHEALRLAGFGGQDVEIRVTLPITQYFYGDSHKRNDDLIKRKKQNLMQSVTNINGQPLANIVDVKVAPESIPAWFDYALDDTGDWVGDLDDCQSVMVIDCGGTTTDLSICNGVGTPRSRFSINKGVFDIANELRTEMVASGLAKTLPRAHLDNVLRTGTYRGKNCLDMIAKASRRVAAEILDQMHSYQPDCKALEKILFVGGGAALIGEDLAKEYGNSANSHIPAEPDLSIARGLVKMQLAEELAEAEA